MPHGDPRDGFFYPTLTLMIDSYINKAYTVWFDGPQQHTAMLMNVLADCSESVNPLSTSVVC